MTAGFRVHGMAAARLDAQLARAREPRPVTTITPNRGAWQTALRIAGGDPRRIEVITPTRLVVHERRVR